MNTILGMGIVLLGGVAAERLVARRNIPAITAYMLLGVAIGPHALGLIDEILLAASGLLSQIVLGFIAFQIGSSFSLQGMRRIGRPVLILSLAEIAACWLLVTAGVYYLAGQPLAIALIFGAISAATAPAATMMVVRQFKARGPLTDLLLGVVAIDDAWGIMIFSLSLALAELLNGTGAGEMALLLAASGEILFSLLQGMAAALLVRWGVRQISQRGDILSFVVGALLLNTGTAMALHLSPLLANMAMGALLVNLEKTAFRLFEAVRAVDWPLYILFYVLAGAMLDIALLPTLGLLGFVYILCRSAGKIAGVYAAGRFSETDPLLYNNLGLALMPQAGVALGLAMSAQANFPEQGELIFTTIAATTVAYEIFGPVATQYALRRAGEIR